MDAVEEALRAHPRVSFLPGHLRRYADRDVPLPIGYGQTNSQPSTVARMLRLLEVPVGGRVLDVGSGSGWTTALLAHLVGPTGLVLGVELDARLAAWGSANLATTEQGWARIEPAHAGVLGLPDEAPFDRILVSAEAAQVPDALVDQLKTGGLMVAPVAAGLCIVRRTASGRDMTRLEGYRFVPLR